MDYLYFALLSAVIFAFIIILVKYISKHIITDFDSFFFWTYIPALPFIFLIPLRYGISFDLGVIIPMIIHALLLTSGQYFFSRGVFLVDASVIGPLFQLQSGFIVLLAAMFLQEHYPPAVYTYIILMMLGAMLVSTTDKTKLKTLFQLGVVYIVAMQLFHAGANIAIGFALKHTTNWQALFYSFVFCSLITTVYAVITKASITTDIKKVRWMFFRAILLLIATALLYKAFETNISVSASLGLLSSPLVFLISLSSVVFAPGLLERQSRRTYFIRTLGTLVIVFAAYHIFLLK